MPPDEDRDMMIGVAKALIGNEAVYLDIMQDNTKDKWIDIKVTDICPRSSRMLDDVLGSPKPIDYESQINPEEFLSEYTEGIVDYILTQVEYADGRQ
jgi:hypothetical protein